MTENLGRAARIRVALHDWRAAVRRVLVARSPMPSEASGAGDGPDPFFPPLDLPSMPAGGTFDDMLQRLLDGEQAAELRLLGLDPVVLAATTCAHTLAAGDRAWRISETWQFGRISSFFTPENLTPLLRSSLVANDLPPPWRQELEALRDNLQTSQANSTPLSRRAAADATARPRMLAYDIPVPGFPGWSFGLDLSPALDGGWVVLVRRTWKGEGEALTPPSVQVQIRDAQSELCLKLDVAAHIAEVGGWLDLDPGKGAVVVVQVVTPDGVSSP